MRMISLGNDQITPWVTFVQPASRPECKHHCLVRLTFIRTGIFQQTGVARILVI